MGKIRDIAENMLLFSDEPSRNRLFENEYLYGYDAADIHYNYAWSLDNYVEQQRREKNPENEWDQLEKSIVAKLADDVIVGVRGKKLK